VAEPAFDAYDAIEKLCQQFEINLAVHNHPKPSNYWNPDVLLKQLQGRGPRLGACCDTGHWVRSGLDPVAMLRKLQGRVISFHLKDVGVVGRADADCVPFGAGKGNIEGILREAKRQGFQGVFGIEYEPYSPQSFANIAQCVAYFDKIVAQL
jgi:sugar phosphate isomerase/epimerase